MYKILTYIIMNKFISNRKIIYNNLQIRFNNSKNIIRRNI